MALVPARYGKKIELVVNVSSALNTSRISFAFEDTDLGLTICHPETPQFLKVAFGTGCAHIPP